jgi:hypothetical protein
MARYSRRHYEDVARILADERSRYPNRTDDTIDMIVLRFKRLFAADNSRFDAERFVKEAT